jgi:hypothetical protein
MTHVEMPFKRLRVTFLQGVKFASMPGHPTSKAEVRAISSNEWLRMHSWEQSIRGVVNP